MAHLLNQPVAEAVDDWLEGANMRRVERVAEIPRSLLYDWRSGKYPTPCWGAAALYRARPDIAAFARVMGLHGLGLQLSRVPVVRGADDVRDSALRVSGDAGDLARLVADVYRDGHKDACESAQLERAAEQLQRAAEELRQLVRVGVVQTPAPRRCVRADGARPDGSAPAAMSATVR